MVLDTKELCRVDYGDKDFKVLKVQHYTDSEPFYFITHDIYERTPVETADHDLNKIVAHLEKCLNIDKQGKPAKGKYGKAVMDITLAYIAKEQEFITQVKKHLTSPF